MYSLGQIYFGACAARFARDLRPLRGLRLHECQGCLKLRFILKFIQVCFFFILLNSIFIEKCAHITNGLWWDRISTYRCFNFYGFFFLLFLFSHIFFDLIFTTPIGTWYVGVRSHHFWWTCYGFAIFVYNILRSISDCLSEEEPSPWIALDFGKRVTVQRVDLFNGKYAIEPTASIEVHISDEIPGRIFVERMPLMGRFDGPATAGQHIIIPGQTNTFFIGHKYWMPIWISQVQEIWSGLADMW